MINKLGRLSEAYFAFNKIREFLERLSCLQQPELQVVGSKLDFIECHCRDFGGDFLANDEHGLMNFIEHELLVQCNINSDSYELIEEDSSHVNMNICGRTISFCIVDCDTDTNPYSDLIITFELSHNEYSDFLAITG